jgi:hypothetical protein
MWIALGLVVLLLWLGLKVVWNVASFGVHLLLIAAAAFVVIHFLRNRFGGSRNTP